MSPEPSCRKVDSQRAVFWDMTNSRWVDLHAFATARLTRRERINWVPAVAEQRKRDRRAFRRALGLVAVLAAGAGAGVAFATMLLLTG